VTCRAVKRCAFGRELGRRGIDGFLIKKLIRGEPLTY
jgi:hypothetical protein